MIDIRGQSIDARPSWAHLGIAEEGRGINGERTPFIRRHTTIGSTVVAEMFIANTTLVLSPANESLKGIDTSTIEAVAIAIAL